MSGPEVTGTRSGCVGMETWLRPGTVLEVENVKFTYLGIKGTTKQNGGHLTKTGVRDRVVGEIRAQSRYIDGLYRNAEEKRQTQT